MNGIRYADLTEIFQKKQYGHYKKYHLMFDKDLVLSYHGSNDMIE
jgi:hypothetical protein